jgi:hypothetical protein
MASYVIFAEKVRHTSGVERGGQGPIGLGAARAIARRRVSEQGYEWAMVCWNPGEADAEIVAEYRGLGVLSFAPQPVRPLYAR